MHFNTLLFIATLYRFEGVVGFSSSIPRTAIQSTSQRCSSPSNSFTLSPLFSSKEDEIAELEEKLRKLKEESSAETTVNDLEFEGSEDSPKPVIDEPFEEMLSESWKDSEESDSGAVVKNLIGAGIAVLLAIVVSQVPVGNDGYDKYTAVKPSTSIDLG